VALSHPFGPPAWPKCNNLRFCDRRGRWPNAKLEEGPPVYLAAGYALSRSCDCAIDERLGAEAPDPDPMHRTGLLGANDKRCDAPEWMLKPGAEG
jgi:hypothetical protein